MGPCDPDEEDGDFERGPVGLGGYEGDGAAARGTQRILVEVAGEVCSRRVRTGGCGSVAELREVLCTACDDIGRFDAADMILEYLDERAGLAILVTDEMGVRGVLDRATLKATFTESVARARPGRARAKPAPGRGRRRAGYERGLVDDFSRAHTPLNLFKILGHGLRTLVASYGHPLHIFQTPLSRRTRLSELPHIPPGTI